MGTQVGWDIHQCCTQVCESPVVGSWDGLWGLLSPSPFSLTSQYGHRSADPNGNLFQQYRHLYRRKKMWHLPHFALYITSSYIKIEKAICRRTNNPRAKGQFNYTSWNLNLFLVRKNVSNRLPSTAVHECWYFYESPSVPALTSLTAHSPGGMPDLSPWGEMHSVAPNGLPLVFSTSTAHAASSTCSKNCSDM